MQCDFEEFAETGQTLREYNNLSYPMQLTLRAFTSSYYRFALPLCEFDQTDEAEKRLLQVQCRQTDQTKD